MSGQPRYTASAAAQATSDAPAALGSACCGDASVQSSGNARNRRCSTTARCSRENAEVRGSHKATVAGIPFPEQSERIVVSRHEGSGISAGGARNVAGRAWFTTEAGKAPVTG